MSFQDLLAQAAAETAAIKHSAWVSKSQAEFASIRKDTHVIAHTIYAARVRFEAEKISLAEVGHKLGGELVAMNKDQTELTSLIKTGKILATAPSAVLAQNNLTERRKLYDLYSHQRDEAGQVNQARLALAENKMRADRNVIILRVDALYAWLHSEEENNRRAAIKAEKQTEALKVIEGNEINAFADMLADLCGRIAVKIGTITELSAPIVAEQERKAAFVARMQAGRAAKKAKKVADAAAVIIQQQAEEAELQRMIEEEAAQKLAAENKVKVEFFLGMAEKTDNLDDAKMYILAAKELDKTINAMVLTNQAAARLAGEEIVEVKQAAKKVEACNIKPVKLHAKERRELARNGVVGKNWANVAEVE